MGQSLIDRSDGTVVMQTGDKLTGAASVVDVSAGPIKGIAAVAINTAVTATKALLVSCTAAGNVNLQFADGSTFAIAVAVGTTLLPFSVTKVLTSGTTATATFADIVV